LTGDGEIGENRHFRRVPVVYVVRRELVVPPNLSSVRIERHEGGCIQVVPEPAFAVIVRARVADAVVEQVEIRIVGTGNPYARAAGLPGIAGPRLIARFARPGNR